MPPHGSIVPFRARVSARWECGAGTLAAYHRICQLGARGSPSLRRIRSSRRWRLERRQTFLGPVTRYTHRPNHATTQQYVFTCSTANGAVVP